MNKGGKVKQKLFPHTLFEHRLVDIDAMEV